MEKTKSLKSYTLPELQRWKEATIMVLAIHEYCIEHGIPYDEFYPGINCRFCLIISSYPDKNCVKHCIWVKFTGNICIYQDLASPNSYDYHNDEQSVKRLNLWLSLIEQEIENRKEKQ